MRYWRYMNQSVNGDRPQTQGGRIRHNHRSSHWQLGFSDGPLLQDLIAAEGSALMGIFLRKQREPNCRCWLVEVPIEEVIERGVGPGGEAGWHGVIPDGLKVPMPPAATRNPLGDESPAEPHRVNRPELAPAGQPIPVGQVRPELVSAFAPPPLSATPAHAGGGINLGGILGAYLGGRFGGLSIDQATAAAGGAAQIDRAATRKAQLAVAGLMALGIKGDRLANGVRSFHGRVLGIAGEPGARSLQVRRENSSVIQMAYDGQVPLDGGRDYVITTFDGKIVGIEPLQMAGA